MARKNALGRGLDALISFNDGDTQGSSSISEVDLDLIVPNTEQPRRDFDEESLRELAASIKSIGVIQPITLRKLDDGTYQIIAGERRYRASRLASLKSIPAYIKTAEDDEIMEMALIENIQREDLNSIEIALAYQKLLENLSITQEQLSDRVGKKRATISNYLRLLKLPAEVQMGVKDKKIDMGHARALVALDDPVAQLKLYNLTVKEHLSVRNVESIVKDFNEGIPIPETTKEEEKKRSSKSASKVARENRISDDFDALKQHLSAFFETDVQFSCNKKGKGKITIPFGSAEELERIIVLFDTLKK